MTTYSTEYPSLGARNTHYKPVSKYTFSFTILPPGPILNGPLPRALAGRVGGTCRAVGGRRRRRHQRAPGPAGAPPAGSRRAVAAGLLQEPADASLGEGVYV